MSLRKFYHHDVAVMIFYTQHYFIFNDGDDGVEIK